MLGIKKTLKYLKCTLQQITSQVGKQMRAFQPYINIAVVEHSIMQSVNRTWDKCPASPRRVACKLARCNNASQHWPCVAATTWQLALQSSEEIWRHLSIEMF